MQIEQMENILGEYIVSYSTKMGHPLKQRLALVKKDVGIKVGQEIIELSVNMVLEGRSLASLVDQMMKLNWLLFTKAKEEKRRLIEKEKQLATAHLEELARFTSVKEFNEFLVTFKRGVITPTKEGE